ncbi:FecR domain-containing protein [Xylophilus sp.]|uniref:FecR domain-containing protein n=1 Tax=Xylophilus sp. TaxID=2653893 RepID=UPI002D7ECE06|nr:FecR domain-containing protein [Xylophilus sp.]
MATPELRRLAACALAACGAAAAAPQAAPAAGDLAHTVAPGDTLVGLAQRYLESPAQWPALRRHNRVPDPLRLVPGSTLWMPAALLRPRPVDAQVAFVQGDVRADDGAVAEGAALGEGARLRVPAGGFVTVQLADGSTVRVQALSDIEIVRSRRRGPGGAVEASFALRRGAAESVVTPQAAPGRRLFEIRTPRAVASVRGTVFDTAVADDGGTAAAVTAGTVAVAAAARGAAPAAVVGAGLGTAVAADGRPLAVRPLLPAVAPGPAAPVGEPGPFTLAWAPVEAARQYLVRIAAGSDFARVVRNGRVEAPPARFEALPDGRYTVSVRAVDADGVPGLDAHWPLVVKTLPLPPLYQHPAPGGTVSRRDGTLECTGVPGARAFHLQVAREGEDFGQPVVDAPRAAACRLDAAALAPGHYAWRAATIGAGPGGADDAGPFAPAQPFAVADSPAGSEPEAGHDAAGAARLFWSGRPGQTFRLQIAADTGFAAPLRDLALDAPAWTDDGLPPGRYYVRLQVRDGADGLASPFSGPREFVVRALLRSDGADGAVRSSDGRPVGRD